ncbi:GerMN domain-containing protein [Thalassiella azotivora]
MRRRAGQRVLALVVAAGCLAACGAPHEGRSRSLEPTQVPYGLLNPPPAPTASPTDAPPGRTVPQVYLLDADDRLVPQASTVDATGLRSVARQVLAQLAAGPTESQRRAGLSSALGPEVTLELLEIEGTTATVEVELPTREPSADRLPLAVGQIVLSLTSVAGVESVRLVQDDERVAAVLPGGNRAEGAVRATDYLPLLAPGVQPPAPADPGPATTPLPGPTGS